jgi:GNAT superfamily N-acetyltransferase
MTSTISIRKAVSADVETMVEFNVAMARETEDKGLDREIVTNGVRAVIEDPNKGFYLLAEFEGRLVGQLMVTFEWSDWRNGNFWWIQSVYVLPEFRGKKIFSILYRKVEDMARNEGGAVGLRLYVEKDNSVARQVYVNIGMRESDYRMYEIDF